MFLPLSEKFPVKFMVAMGTQSWRPQRITLVYKRCQWLVVRDDNVPIKFEHSRPTTIRSLIHLSEIAVFCRGTFFSRTVYIVDRNIAISAHCSK